MNVLKTILLLMGIFGILKSAMAERPNSFFAVQIANKDIQDALQDVQYHVLSQDPDLISAAVSIKKSHVTLDVFRISNDRQLKEVKRILEHGVADFIETNGDNPITVKLQGLGNFNDQVVFANVLFPVTGDETRFLNLWQILADRLKSSGFIDSDDVTRFHRHVTIFNLSQDQKNKGEIIDSSLYSIFNSTQFGPEIQLISVQLLSMQKKPVDGYYYIEEEVKLF